MTTCKHIERLKDDDMRSDFNSGSLSKKLMSWPHSPCGYKKQIHDPCESFHLVSNSSIKKISGRATETTSSGGS